MDFTRCLILDEVAQCVEYLHHRAFYAGKYRRGVRGRSQALNLAIFRLACCCGLRRNELTQLRMRDFMFTGPRPCIRVRKEITKGRDGKRRARVIPLWWDKGTLLDLKTWAAFRKKLPGTYGGECGPDSLFLAGVDSRNLGRKVAANKAADRWKTAIRCLGAERQRQVSIHGGRHTFCTLALAGGHSLAEVKEAAGHSNISTTSIYLHAIERHDLPDVFAVRRDDPASEGGNGSQQAARRETTEASEQVEAGRKAGRGEQAEDLALEPPAIW